MIYDIYDILIILCFLLMDLKRKNPLHNKNTGSWIIADSQNQHNAVEF